MVYPRAVFNQTSQEFMGARELLQVLAVLLLCLTHLYVSRLRFLHRQEGWLSFTGGAASAYVFVYILPKLGYQQLILAGAVPAEGWLGYLQHHAYLVAFAGFLSYFGVTRIAERVQVDPNQPVPLSVDEPLEALHVGAMALYALLVGYLLADYQGDGWAPIALATTALTLHFIGASHVILKRYGPHYDRWIRWLMVAATIAGAGIGALTTLRPTIVALWFAFLAGAIIVIVLEQEIPHGEHSHFGWFFSGAAFFSALALTAEITVI